MDKNSMGQNNPLYSIQMFPLYIHPEIFNFKSYKYSKNGQIYLVLLIYCKQTFIRNYKLACDDQFSWVSLIRTCVVITNTWQGLVHSEKYSRWRGSRELRLNFLLANKSWSTVYYIYIYVNYNDFVFSDAECHFMGNRLVVFLKKGEFSLRPGEQITISNTSIHKLFSEEREPSFASGSVVVSSPRDKVQMEFWKSRSTS